MKRLIYLTLTLVLVACGTRRGYFNLDGRLLNLNQGEFYVYSPDGVFDGIDTIKVEGGRFTFETQCKESGTLERDFYDKDDLARIAKFLSALE